MPAEQCLLEMNWKSSHNLLFSGENLSSSKRLIEQIVLIKGTVHPKKIKFCHHLLLP